MLKETAHKIDFNGEQVIFRVSPCSWMHKGYGLQVGLSMKENAVNAESEFIRDESYEATDKPMEELDRAGRAFAEKWLAENGTALLHEHVAKWQAAKDEFDKEFAEEDKKAAAAQKRADARYKKKGYTHRVNAWIHPSQGDDFQSVSYVMGEPSEKDIAQILRRSEVKTDYVVTAL